MNSAPNIFIVSSVYQLFNAINITEQNASFEKTSVIMIELNDNALFSNVVDIDYLKAKFKDVHIVNIQRPSNRLSKIIYVLRQLLSKSYQKLNDREEADVFISGTEIYSKVIAYQLMMKNSNLYYYEDGFGSYNSVLDKMSKKKQDVVFKLLYNKYPLQKCSGLFVYEPQKVCCNSYGTKIFRIKKINRMESRVIDYKKVYKGNVITFNKNYIFLNSWFDDLRFYTLQDNLTEITKKIVGEKDLCIKSHPNEWKKSSTIQGVEVINSKSSFEISNYYQAYNNKIFISVDSTASLSPGLVYGDQPIVIFLYKIFENEFNCNWGANTTFQVLTSDNPNVYFPDTMEEYKQIIEGIKRNDDQKN